MRQRAFQKRCDSTFTSIEVHSEKVRKFIGLRIDEGVVADGNWIIWRATGLTDLVGELVLHFYLYVST